VDATMLPRSMASSHDRLRIATDARAMPMAVRKTPAVASTNDGAMTRWNVDMSVRRPPSNKIMSNAAVPTP
jgi:hypothetical protein